jgi:hypothetical protein
VWIEKQLAIGQPAVEARLRWWIENFRFRASQAVDRLRTGAWNVAELQEWGRVEIKDTLYGIAETGAGRRLARREIYAVRRTLKEQTRFWDRFASDTVSKMKALAEEGLTGPELAESRERMLQGIERRAMFYHGAIEAEGQKWAMAARFKDGQWFRWDLNPAEHCQTCLDREGKMYRMKEGRLPFYPKDGSTICLFNCLCEWTPMLRPPTGERGRLGPMGARRRGKKLATEARA